MALSLAKAAPLKPEIKLAQALSEFEAILPDDQKAKLRIYHRESPPNPTDVMRLTAEIDRDASRNRKSRQCVGPRLTNVLHAIQQFSTVVDLIVGSSQSQIASAIWGAVKISLQLASAVSSYFDQLSTLFMSIGRTSPRYQDFGLLYPESKRLQSALCDYFVVIVHLCKQAVLFLKKPFWSQLSFSILKPFESEFRSLQLDLENLANAIREKVFLASNQAQQKETKEMSRFRGFFSDTSTRDIAKARKWKRKEAELRFLNAFSIYNHEKSWKQARKQGNTNWICHDEGYKQWKLDNVSSSLWCTGKLGSGKTVLSANVVEDLRMTTSDAVAYFFCRYDETTSLETRTIIGSIARQILDHIKSYLVDAVAETRPDTMNIDQILKYLQELPPSNSQKYFIIIDGLDECEEIETRLLLQCLKELLMSKHVFQVYCSSRPDVFRWAHTVLEPQWNLSMPSRINVDIEEYVEDALESRLDSGKLSMGNSTIILTIRDTLLKKADGMFLWVNFQIDSLCSQKTDEAILAVLEDLPKDLPETFNRVLRKLQYSNGADPLFCIRIFDLVAAAQRPLFLEELREAVSVKPGETSWDTSKLVNDMFRSLLDSCGSLVAIDEEYLTVHFAHHSVKQHLLSAPTDSDMKKYHINMREADLYLGDIIVTYLNLGVFNRQLAKIKSTTLPEVKNYPSAILRGSLPQSNINRLAVRLLRSREKSRFDLQSQLKTAVGIVDRSEEPTQQAHFFLPYAQEHWLFHTKMFKPTREPVYALWKRLVDEEIETVEMPQALQRSHEIDAEFGRWITGNQHWALINWTLVIFARNLYYSNVNFSAVRLLLDFLEPTATDLDVDIVDFEAALYVASYWNSQAIVLLSLKKGVDINVKAGVYGTALQAASFKGHEEIVRLLLENGANVNAEGGEYWPALQGASSQGYNEIVRFLLENGANVNAEGGDYSTALQGASSEGHEEIVRLLLDNGANVDGKVGKSGSALYRASVGGLEGIVRLLLENGANVDAEGGEYGTALQGASSQGRKEIVRLLLENGANVNAEGGKYGTALQGASSRGYNEIVRLLLENGANVNAEGGKCGTALRAASIQGHEEIVRLLLENRAYVNAEGGEYGTALRAASIQGHKEIVRFLLENGANVNAEGEEYGTALYRASVNGYQEIVRLLLENGANVNAEGGDYGPALCRASVNGDEGIVRLLLDNGANVNAEGGIHGTSLQLASLLGYEETVRLLLKNGAVADLAAMTAANSSGDEEVKRLIRNALKHQQGNLSMLSS